MKLLFKQRFFSWFDSYDIYDETGAAVYTVEGKLSFGHHLEIHDAMGNEVATLQVTVLTFLPKFDDVYWKNAYVGCIRKGVHLPAPQVHPGLQRMVCGGAVSWQWGSRILDGSGARWCSHRHQGDPALDGHLCDRCGASGGCAAVADGGAGH